MEMRKCKECGKMFTPKGREQYCSDVHYRPCPICGKPVIAKYLSDPPRRCDDCKKANKKVNSTNKVEERQQTPSTQPFVMPRQETLYKYVGPKLDNSFIPGHLYKITVERNSYAYEVSSMYDESTKEYVDLFRLYSSKISLGQNFVEVNH